MDSSVSEHTLQELDAEIRRLLDEAEAKATTVLTEHQGQLDAMAQLLVEEETLEGAPLEELLATVRVLGANGASGRRKAGARSAKSD